MGDFSRRAPIEGHPVMKPVPFSFFHAGLQG
jgi:hypothetical protein